MTLQHTPLDVSKLSANAQRALGPGPGRMMAARGLVPLPPVDQANVLYQLSLETESMLSQAAKSTAAGMPEKLLAGTLADPSLDRRVLDFFAQLVTDKPSVFEALAMNTSVADDTIAGLAARVGSREVDLIANNEERLLRHPEIIAAMYMNRRARMSTIDRIVELAVRNNVRVPGLACWDEVARALTGAAESTPDQDLLFSAAVEEQQDDTHLTTGNAEEALPEEQPEEEEADEDKRWDKLTIPAKVRLATLGNAVARGKAIRDPIKLVAVAAIKSPGVTDIEAARYASNQALAEDVIRYIATNRSWTKLYGVKVSLCRNPKAPISETTRFLPFLRAKDLEKLSKSKGIPSAVAANARKLVMQRGGK